MTDNYVKLMADYTSTGVWDTFGHSILPGSLPISESLKNRITEWQAEYDKYAFDAGFDIKTFSRIGLSLAGDIKDELPGWVVIYFDESASNIKDAYIEIV